jgi:hypothetical protein
MRGLLGSVSGAGPAAVWKFLQGCGHLQHGDMTYSVLFVPSCAGSYYQTGKGHWRHQLWHVGCRNVKELYDRLDGGTRAAASVAGLVVDAAKQPAAGATAEQLQALFRQHDSVSHEIDGNLVHSLLGRPQK